MRICDRCDKPAIHVVDRVCAESSGGVSARTLWERSLTIGDLCEPCMDRLTRLVSGFMNEKEPRAVNTHKT